MHIKNPLKKNLINVCLMACQKVKAATPLLKEMEYEAVI